MSVRLESHSGGLSFGNEDDDVLLSKPANREQLEIAKQLARRDCVLVQGPPGTGKTHTIANLLGHLLAQGKRVLVTAHTPKALRVLRQKVVEPLQPLCVSVLHNDKQSQEELQASVRKIHVRLSDDDRLLERDAQRLRGERKRILEALRDARQQLLDARQDEIRDVVFGGKSTRPIDAAKRVKEGVGKDDWIPSPVNLGESLPLSHAEVVALYQTNARVPLADERELAGRRPDLSTLPTPNEFRSAVEEMTALAGQNLRLREELWDSTREPDDLTEFDRMLELASKTIEFLRDSAPWQLVAVQAGRDGEQARRVWESLAELIESTWCEVQECHALVMEHGPEVSDPRPPHELLALVDEIIQHHEAGNSFGLTREADQAPLVRVQRKSSRWQSRFRVKRFDSLARSAGAAADAPASLRLGCTLGTTDGSSGWSRVFRTRRKTRAGLQTVCAANPRLLGMARLHLATARRSVSAPRLSMVLRFWTQLHQKRGTTRSFAGFVVRFLATSARFFNRGAVGFATSGFWQYCVLGTRSA